ncbi:MAG: hypothetical protein J6A28_03500 [Clostridia bacterium]|nr:hypothetical protein [Clostridia bacterium]
MIEEKEEQAVENKLNTKKRGDLVDELTAYREEIEKNIPSWQEFGNGLVYAQTVHGNKVHGGGKIYKGDKLIGVSDIPPFGSIEQGGLFMVFADSKRKTYRYVNEDGFAYKRVYGKRSSPFRNGFARVQIIDEPYNEEELHTVGTKKPAYFTFMKRIKPGHYSLMKSRFSQASFMDESGLAKVVFAGEKHLAYVGTDGKALPYRFKDGDEVSREFEVTKGNQIVKEKVINVKFLDGKPGVIKNGGFVYKLVKGQEEPATEYENILTLEELDKLEKI